MDDELRGLLLKFGVGEAVHARLANPAVGVTSLMLLAKAARDDADRHD